MLSSPSLPAAHGLGPRQIPLRPLVGYLAIAVTVLVWAGFALSTRAASGAQPVSYTHLTLPRILLV